MPQKCQRCGAEPAERTWDMRPCAAGRKTTYRLCEACDLALNRIVLEFFRVPDRDALLVDYERSLVE